MNILIPADLVDLIDDNIALQQDIELDSDCEDEEEKEVEKELEGEDSFLELDPFSANSSRLSSLIMNEFKAIRMRIYLDIETPPPNC